MEYILLFVLVAIILVPAILIGKGIVTGKKAKFAMIFNIIAFFAICGGCLIDPLSGLALASGEAVGAGAIASSAAGMGYLSAAISVGVGCIGGGVAVASSASTAIGALSENPKIMGKAIIFVALAEGIALYGMLIAIQILNKI